MPLLEGHSQEVFAANVRELIRAGHPRKQAIAIALEKARKDKARRRDAEISDETREFVRHIAHARMAAGLMPRTGRHATGQFKSGVSGNPAGRPKGHLPRQHPPNVVMRDYLKAMMRLVLEPMRAAYAHLLRELPTLAETARRELGHADARADAGESRRASELLAEARAQLEAQIKPGDLERLARRIAMYSESWNREQLRRQVRAALGVDPIFRDSRITALLESFVSENVAMIKSIPEVFHGRVEAVVMRGLADGSLPTTLTQQISEEFGVAEGRARTIARDQVGKLVGQINASRQKEMGVRKFIWRTAGDSRVRGYSMRNSKTRRRKQNHYRLNGQTFEYANPPDNGTGKKVLPGQDVQCRCYAEPVFDDILDMIERGEY